MSCTRLMSRLLEHEILNDRIWVDEAPVAPSETFTLYGAREDTTKFVDYLALKEKGSITETLNNFCFEAYEIKSGKSDLKSGCGLNFVGHKNYLVIPPTLYKELPRELLVDRNIGIYVILPTIPVLERNGKNEYNLFLQESIQPTPIKGREDKWMLYLLRDSEPKKAILSNEELLFALVKGLLH